MCVNKYQSKTCLQHAVPATKAMTCAKFISLDYKHFLRMFFCRKCLSASGQIGAVLENEVTCNDKYEDILLQILFVSSLDVSDQFDINSQRLLARLVPAMTQCNTIP